MGQRSSASTGRRECAGSRARGGARRDGGGVARVATRCGRADRERGVSLGRSRPEGGPQPRFSGPARHDHGHQPDGGGLVRAYAARRRRCQRARDRGRDRARALRRPSRRFHEGQARPHRGAGRRPVPAGAIALVRAELSPPAARGWCWAASSTTHRGARAGARGRARRPEELLPRALASRASSPPTPRETYAPREDAAEGRAGRRARADRERGGRPACRVVALG